MFDFEQTFKINILICRKTIALVYWDNT